MLFFKVIFFSVLLSCVSAQILTSCWVHFKLSRFLGDALSPEIKQAPTSELLKEFIKERGNLTYFEKGEYIDGAISVDVQKAINFTRNFTVVKLDTLTPENEKFFRKATREKKSVITHRVGSRAEKQLEDAARWFIAYIAIRLLYRLITRFLKLINSSARHIFAY